jgi:hypothetical protein
MAGAADFMVGNAPGGANFAAPLLGFGIGDRLADLPNRYFQGTQQARTLALQNAFPNGLPTTDGTPNGPVDVNAVMQTLTKTPTETRCSDLDIHGRLSLSRSREAPPSVRI